MAPTPTPFRFRAASLLHPFSSPKSSEDDPPNEKSSRSRRASTEPSPNEKPQCSEQSEASKKSQISEKSTVEERGDQRKVRSVPVWVQTLDEDDEEINATTHLLPPNPPPAQIAQHNHSPAARLKGKPEPGRLHDAQREWTPPMPSVHTNETASQWRAFAHASVYPTTPSTAGTVVDEEWLAQNGPDYSKPWLAGAGDEDTEADMHFWKAKEKVWWQRAQHTILRNPMIPLAFRSIVWMTSVAALAIAGSIYKLTNDHLNARNTASTKMAISVDAVALVYILYITYDEYTGKPLGLRSARAKLRLLFLDLIFIVFDSANLSLAFQAVQSETNEAKCRPGKPEEFGDDVCRRKRGLASLLLIALIAWLLTFSTSVLRIVERVNHR